MRQLTREEIFAAEDLQTEEVPVPEWGEGCSVRVRAFSVAVRDAFFAPLQAAAAGDDQARVEAVRALSHTRLVAFSVVDADGNNVFTEADLADLGKKSPVVITRIAQVAERLNGIGAVQIEAAAKNSAASPN